LPLPSAKRVVFHPKKSPFLFREKNRGGKPCREMEKERNRLKKELCWAERGGGGGGGGGGWRGTWGRGEWHWPSPSPITTAGRPYAKAALRHRMKDFNAGSRREGSPPMATKRKNKDGYIWNQNFIGIGTKKGRGFRVIVSNPDRRGGLWANVG